MYAHGIVLLADTSLRLQDLLRDNLSPVLVILRNAVLFFAFPIMVQLATSTEGRSIVLL